MSRRRNIDPVSRVNKPRMPNQQSDFNLGIAPNDSLGKTPLAIRADVSCARRTSFSRFDARFRSRPRRVRGAHACRRFSHYPRTGLHGGRPTLV
jgi:hypothetical protein